MDVDLEDGTDNLEQPADDIASSLAAALAQAEAPEGDAGADVTLKPDGDSGAGAPTLVRGPDGKFVKKEVAAEPAAPATATADKPAQEQVAVAAPAAESKEPPAHWSAADKETFKALPEQGQKFVLDRFKAMEGDYTRKTQEIANFKKEYGRVDEMFAPHKDVMRQKGFTPSLLIEAWANVETKLAAGPDSAVDVIKGLVSGYNIPPEKLAAALGLNRATGAQQDPGQQLPPAAVENGQPVALPPETLRELQDLRQRVGTLDQRYKTIEQRDAEARRYQELQQEQAADNIVNEFRSAKDDKGILLHPHMEEVEGLMTSLANAALASKQPVPSLKELYETAVYANPSTREKVLTAQRQQEEAKRTEAAKAKSAAARRAGSSVTGAPGSGQAPGGKPGSELSLREQLEAAADEAA